MRPTHLLRVKCGCAFKVTKDEANSVANGKNWPCPKHGLQPFKFSKFSRLPTTPPGVCTCDNEQGCDLHDKPKRLVQILGEKRLTPREEALKLVAEVYEIREQRAMREARITALREEEQRLLERERVLTEKLGEEHGLFYNPDR